MINLKIPNRDPGNPPDWHDDRPNEDDRPDPDPYYRNPYAEQCMEEALKIIKGGRDGHS